MPLLVMLTLSGCGSDRRTVYPVHGQILVDGKPAGDAFIYLHAQGDADPRVVRPVGQADEDGKFFVSTYVSGDGAPPGEYIATFEWRGRSGLMKQDFGGPDKLRGLYADAKKSSFRIKVETKAVELPPFELSIKGPKS